MCFSWIEYSFSIQIFIILHSFQKEESTVKTRNNLHFLKIIHNVNQIIQFFTLFLFMLSMRDYKAVFRNLSL